MAILNQDEYKLYDICRNEYYCTNEIKNMPICKNPEMNCKDCTQTN